MCKELVYVFLVGTLAKHLFHDIPHKAQLFYANLLEVRLAKAFLQSLCFLLLSLASLVSSLLF